MKELFSISRIISKAEEECCDAVAVRQTSGDRRTYAEALLQAIDFVSEPEFVPAASGAVRSGLIRLRIRQIMAKRKLESQGIGPGFFFLFVVALLPFPWISSSGFAASVPTAPAYVRLSTPTQFIASDAPVSIPAVEEEATEWMVKVETDDFHRASFVARNEQRVELGVGRVSQSASAPFQDQLAIGTTDGVIELYSTATGERQTRIDTGASCAISVLQYCQDGDVLAFANRSGLLTLIDSMDGEKILRIRKPFCQVTEIQFDDDQNLQLTWEKRGCILREKMQFLDGKWTLADAR